MLQKIKKILIANRGEIAVRILKACREMKIPSVAVYSEADRNSLHLTLADQVVYIGPPPALQSYLNFEAIISAAKKTSANAIHPGYGFLAENAEFAQCCKDEHIIFIGPSAEAILAMGDKVISRETMKKAGLPIIPGSKGNLSFEQIKLEAERLGLPILIKASAGGGGKGMRIVYEKSELKPALEAAQREAKAAFGNENVYLEKFFTKPRHIEFQILADEHGNYLHLNERECSIQRRHQKIIEETPSVALDEELRQKMGKAAVNAAQACNYTNAGTVEFLLDQGDSTAGNSGSTAGNNGKFYFLEMNTRIQVEHPVTEATLGIDLVKKQILVADGQELDLSQADLKARGHAMECRIYAEDPENNFLPSPGKILHLNEPYGPGIRNDSGIYNGWNIPTEYDPILAKLVVWSENRAENITKMIEALNRYCILGVKTNITFLKEVLNHPKFKVGEIHTYFVDEHFRNWSSSIVKEPDLGNSEELKTEPKLPTIKKVALATVALDIMHKSKKKISKSTKKQSYNPWLEVGSWEIANNVPNK